MPDKEHETVECMEVKFEREDGDDLYVPAIEKQMVDVMAKEIQREIDRHIFETIDAELKAKELERQRKVKEERRRKLEEINKR
jgi:hypothetical protein